MKKILIGFLILILILGIAFFAIGPIQLLYLYGKPSTSFEKDVKAAKPDYSLVENWAALPSIDDLSDRRPQGVIADTALKAVDVFFIHPTGYMKGTHWNSMLDANSATEENTKWMMTNQASAFSDCQVYAPRYREATIFVFFNLEGADSKAALDLAYQDVEQAFDYFIENYNKERPFIIASHSQGSTHALPLIKNRIDGTPLAQRMIAAYTIGTRSITNESVRELKDIAVCDAPDQTQCLIHWATWEETVDEVQDIEMGTKVCVNPLTWKRDGAKAEKNLHKGYVKTSGPFSLEFTADDKAKNVSFPVLEAPLVAHTCATCKDGMLLVEKQDFPSFGQEGNYHGLDFQLFHMDIRKNIAERVKAYWATKPK